MAITSLQFMYDQFEAEKWRFFGIYDERGEVVYKQMANLEPEKAYNKLREWFKQNFGTFTVKVFMKANSMAAAMEQNTLARFTVEVTGQNQPVGMGTIYGQQQQQGAPVYAAQPSNNVFDGAPNQWNLVDQNHGFRTELQLMKKDHDHQREMDQMRRELDALKAEQGKSRGMGAIVDRVGEQFSDPAVLMGLISGVSRLFNKPSAPQGPYQPAQHITPMNGIPGGIAPTTTAGRVDFEVARNADKRRDKLVSAVNQLMESDPDFPENMAKLAALSRSNPAVYKMAISYLNTL
jgi:hypothetical protein